MAALKLKQLQYETETLRRLLAFMMEETVHLQNRIVEILNDPIDESLLDEIENFQHLFLKEEELVSLLSNDIAALNSILEKGIYEDKNALEAPGSRLKKLHVSIIRAEEQFSRLKLAFNMYLSKNLD